MKSIPFNLSQLAFCVLIGQAVGTSGTALAEQTRQSVQTFNIPAGPLDKTLLAISRTSAQVISFDPALLTGQQAPAIQGNLNIDQAISRALRDTQLTHTNGPDGILITPQTKASAGVSTPLATHQPATVPQLEQVVVVGTRRKDQTALSTSAPVDVISAEQLRATGNSNLAKALEGLVPSVNYPLVNGSDGVSSQRPANLRGLAADQVLVLLNGKRQHASAFVNTKNTVGRGAQAVDLATIPVSAVERIEVLRDGASAQYGSDAIAGVINIVLKERNSGGELEAVAGKYTKGDGFSRTVDGWTGLSLPGDGFLTLSFEGNRRERTETGGQDSRRFYPTNNPTAEANADRHWRYGSAGLENWSVGANAGASLSDNLDAYALAIYQDRTSHSQAQFRRPIDTGNLISVYPDGFLPLLDVRSRDLTSTAGLKLHDETLGDFDLSANYGRNRIDYRLSDSINVSLGPTSPTRFNAGALINEQTNLALDHVKEFQVGYGAGPLVFGSGVAWRHEVYEALAGDDASWVNGNSLGGSLAAGSQGFPGTQPTDAGRYSRNVLGGYLSLEQQLTDKLQVGAAARSENYSDFGSTSTGKLSARYDFTPAVALRSTVSTGYRAPSLGQIGNSSTNTTFRSVNGVLTPFEVIAFNVDNPAARALGASDLKPEKSTNLSVGLVLQPSREASVSLDAYQITIKDRIALSENFTGSLVQSVLSRAGYNSVSGASFFTNALDTRTTGFDLTGRYALDLAELGKLELSLGYNHSRTKVTDIKANPGALAGTGLDLVGRQQLSILERGSPDSKLILSAHWQRDKWQASVAQIRYGRYEYDHVTDPALDQTFAAQWVTNASVAYDVTDALTLTLGGDNLFDSYPDKVRIENRSGGNVNQWSSLSPNGAEGAFYYLRANYYF